MNNGSGGFGSIKTYYCGGDSQSVVAGDFNGDGKIDLAVANSSGAGGVGVLLGNGTGGFATATLYPDTGLCIAAGDFNGDGIPDLAVALDGLPYMGVLLGVGNGSFATTTTIACGRTITYSMAAADFNGDGKTDLAAATGSGVAVLLATASGGLGSPTTYATASGQSNFVVVGDFNGDGIPDLAVDVDNGSASGVAVLLGNGSGGFGNATFYLTGNPSADSLTTSLAVADFNNDGKPDLAEIGSNGVSVLLNNGAGAFGAPTTYSTGGTDPFAVAVGDFNGDGNADIAVANQNSSNVGVLLGNGHGGFGTVTTFSSGVSTPWSMTAGDLNGDGRTDLVIGNDGGKTISVLLANGTGGFDAPASYSCGGALPYALALGDFNGDGKTDLAVATNVCVDVLLGNGSGAFGNPIPFTAGYAGTRAVASGDFIGDGTTDLAVANANGTIGLLPNIYGPAPITLTSQDGTFFDVAAGNFGAGELVEGTNNAFHGDGRLLVGSKPYSPTLLDSTLGDGGCSVTTGTGTAAGLTVSRKVTVPNTGSQDFARTIDTFTNPTGSPIATTVTIVGDLGSGAGTTVFATSDGTGIVSPNDQWIGTDGGSSPAVIHYIRGPAGLKPVSVAVTGSNISWTYNITVHAGQTVTLAYFTIVSPTQAGAIAAANALVTPGGFGGQAGAFLDATPLSSLANFLFPPVATVAVNEHSPLPQDVLTATATNWDPYGNPVTLTYVWTVNGTVKRTSISTALTDTFALSTLGGGDVGDTVVISVTPNDSILNHLGYRPDRHVRPEHPGGRRRGRYDRRLGDAQRRHSDRHDRERHGHGGRRAPGGHGDAQRTRAPAPGYLDGHGHQIGRRQQSGKPDLRLDGQRDGGADVYLGHRPDRHVQFEHTGRRRRRRHSRRLGDAQRRHSDRHYRERHGHGDQHAASDQRGGRKRRLEQQFPQLPGRPEPQQRRRLFHPGRQRRQLLPLPWTNIDEIKVTFNENVTVAQADLMLVGVNTPSYNVAGGTFSYNAATFTATWMLPAAIPDDKLLLELNAAGSDPIEDALGNRLDGYWTNPATTASTATSQYPSGDGMPGGNFLFRFNVLPGDVNQDGYVEAVDGLLVRGRWRRRRSGRLLDLQGHERRRLRTLQRRAAGAGAVGQHPACRRAGGDGVSGGDGP